MKSRFFKLTIIITFFASISQFPASTVAQNDFPFQPKEKMTFHVRWSFILAGEAVLEVLPVENFNGFESYHFVLTAKTSPFVDIFYKVRDRIDSYTDVDMTHSLLYNKNHQGRSKEETTVEFDWEKEEAQYIAPGQNWEPIPVMPGTFDPLSVFYAFRLHSLDEQTELGIPVTDGKKSILGKAKVIKRQEITLGSTSFDTFLVEPEMEHIGGVFEKSRNAKIQIWVTADDRRIPIRIKSKVRVGSFVADLVSFEDGGSLIDVTDRMDTPQEAP
jgi:hypothetical protein